MKQYAQEVSIRRVELSVGDPEDKEVKRALREINFGLKILRRALISIGDPKLIDIYENMTIRYSHYDRDDSDGRAEAVADFKAQSIHYFKSGGALRHTPMVFLTLHEFRHLQEVNFKMINAGEYLTKPWHERSWEVDAQRWATDVFNNHVRRGRKK